MKYIRLLAQRVNLSNVAHYYPVDEAASTHLGKIETFYIKLVFSGGAVLNVVYDGKEDRNSDIKRLDESSNMQWS